MKQLVEFTLEDGESILVEVEVERGFGTEPASRGEEVPKKAAEAFEKAMATIKNSAKALLQTVKSLVEQPDEITAEFGIKFTGEGKAIVASAGVEANFKIVLKWTNA